jgi:hypothetical protein
VTSSKTGIFSYFLNSQYPQSPAMLGKQNTLNKYLPVKSSHTAVILPVAQAKTPESSLSAVSSFNLL